MTQELKDIFEKKTEDLTDEDRQKAKEAVEAFKAEIDEVCRKHSLAYQAVINVSTEGIVPSLNIVRIKDEEKD